MDTFTANGVYDIPGTNARAAFTHHPDSKEVFREDAEMAPSVVPGIDKKYWRWGADNMQPHNLIDLIEKDETLSSCLKFQAEVLCGAGLKYCVPDSAPKSMSKEIDDFFEGNALPGFQLGTCMDLKYFGFAVSVIILSKDRSRISRIIRKHACYCRFGVDENNVIDSVIYDNWRASVNEVTKPEVIPLLDVQAPMADLRERIKTEKHCKYAILTKIPTADNTVYPIPNYGALFKGKWYDIKQLIGLAKLTKLKNSAPIRYHIQISSSYWERLLRREKITDPKKQQDRVAQERHNIITFLTGLENSGKVWFSETYVNPKGETCSDVVINKIDTEKEGGDWASDLQEAVNMICFTLGVHSNLVGSVPGKSQSNNSGSDKRELFTIAQAQQTPYRQLIYSIHRLIIGFNGWRGVVPEMPLIQLTTLDKHTDSQYVTSD